MKLEDKFTHMMQNMERDLRFDPTDRTRARVIATSREFFQDCRVNEHWMLAKIVTRQVVAETALLRTHVAYIVDLNEHIDGVRRIY